jgi:5-hydroxyisourate hydrolase
MSPITTHVLDTTHGRPATGVFVRLERLHQGGADLLGEGRTDADGRLRDLLHADATLTAGPHRLTFDTAAYFEALGVQAFYPTVQVTFMVHDPSQHLHVPLLLSPYGYSTYRGS